jgi:hypothetical protein
VICREVQAQLRVSWLSSQPTPVPLSTPGVVYATPTPSQNVAQSTPPPSVTVINPGAGTNGGTIYSGHVTVDNPRDIYGPIVDQLRAQPTPGSGGGEITLPRGLEIARMLF